MTQDNQAAATSLLERAYRAKTSGELDILLGSAKRLDPSLDIEAIAQLWQDKQHAARAQALEAR